MPLYQWPTVALPNGAELTGSGIFYFPFPVVMRDLLAEVASITRSPLAQYAFGPQHGFAYALGELGNDTGRNLLDFKIAGRRHKFYPKLRSPFASSW